MKSGAMACGRNYGRQYQEQHQMGYTRIEDRKKIKAQSWLLVEKNNSRRKIKKKQRQEKLLKPEEKAKRQKKKKRNGFQSDRKSRLRYGQISWGADSVNGNSLSMIKRKIFLVN